MAAPASRMNEARRWMAFVLLAYTMLLRHGGLCTSGTPPTSAPQTFATSDTSLKLPTTTNGPVNTVNSEPVPGSPDLPSTEPSDPPTRTQASAMDLTSSATQKTFTQRTSIPMILDEEDTHYSTSKMEANISTNTTTTLYSTSQETMHITEEKQSNQIMLEFLPPAIFNCVNQEAVKDKDVVMVMLTSTSSTCEDTKTLLQTHGANVCEGCTIDLFQENDTLYVTGDEVEADVNAMAEKFKSEKIKNELQVLEAKPLWAKRSPTVLVAMLLTGLLVAALLIGCYVLKNYRARSAKGMRLTEELYPVDEENQGNTLVSVAPLSAPEAQEKPNINGESPDGVKNQQPPVNPGGATTNGHSASKTPVADTQL